MAVQVKKIGWDNPRLIPLLSEIFYASKESVKVRLEQLKQENLFDNERDLLASV
jgi:hypothetical protein